MIKFERSIYTFFNFLGDVGGLISVFSPIISMIVKIISPLKMKSKIANKLFLQLPSITSTPVKIKKQPIKDSFDNIV